MAVWELTQRFAPLLGIPPIPLWRFEAALFPETCWPQPPRWVAQEWHRCMGMNASTDVATPIGSARRESRANPTPCSSPQGKGRGGGRGGGGVELGGGDGERQHARQDPEGPQASPDGAASPAGVSDRWTRAWRLRFRSQIEALRKPLPETVAVSAPEGRAPDCCYPR